MSPAKWRGYPETAAKAGNTSAYRHYWELCVLLGLRDGLRIGDLHVPAHAATPTWPPTCELVSKPTDPDQALATAIDGLGLG